MSKNKLQKQKGFTLIELLIVIAIVAVLAVAVVLTINPAELLKQARDSSRISDLAALNSALSLYIADGQSPPAAWSGTTCYSDTPGATCHGGVRFSGAYTTTSSSTSQAVDGTGWVPVNFTAISYGSPISQLPRDPVHNTTYFYAFAGSSTSGYFKITANMESNRYSNGGSSDVENTDGGDYSGIYEVGTKLNL